MLTSLWHLFTASAQLSINWMGTTLLGVSVSASVFSLVLLNRLRRKGWADMKQHWKTELSFGVGWILRIWGTIFLVATVYNVYTKHTFLQAALSKCEHDKEDCKVAHAADDLKVIFQFNLSGYSPEWPITLNATFFNAGPRPVQIKDVDALVAIIKPVLVEIYSSGQEPQQANKEPCDFSDFSIGELEFQFLTGANPLAISPKPFEYQVFKLEMQPVEINPAEIKTVTLKIDGIRPIPNDANEEIQFSICPVVRYFNASAEPKISVCAGYSKVQKGNPPRMMQGPISTQSIRLLPHADMADCPVIASEKS